MNSGNIFYNLSESQKSIWYLEKAHSGTSINIVAGNVRLQGDVDYPALQKSLNLFVKKNESMRLHIVEEDGEAFQYVTEYQEFDIDFFDFSENGGLKALFAWDEETTKKPFDIIGNQLYYCALFKLSEKEGGFYMKMHHLISDAWTMGLLGKQVIDAYSNIKKGLTVEESPNPSYIDHVRMEEAYTTSLRYEKDRKYWNEKFESLPEMTVLKTQKSGEASIKAKRKTMITPAKFSKKLRQFSKENSLSIFTLFMAALAIYINRVADYQDMVLGTTILNRVNARDKRTTGMFVSVAAPVRITLDDDMDFKTFAGVMLKESTDVLKHQKYPYNYLIRDLKKKHKFSNRLFDIVLSYQNSKLNKNESEEEYVAKWLFSGCQIESLVISINDREEEGNLLIDYDFLTDVFSVKEIEFIHQHILRLLWHGLDNPAREISKLEMISEKEKHTIVYDFNDTAAEFPRDKTIHQIFEEQAENTPDNIALVFKNETMTYAQLNKRANQLARTLREQGIGPDDVVGLIVDRSFEMIISIFAVLKAGGAYMPIDPGYPSDRKQYMLENSGAKALLTKQSFLSDITFDGLIIDLEDESSYAADGSNQEHVNKPNDLLYIIYTSGSTGKPKGVMIEHRNLVGLLFNDQFEFDFNASDVWTLFHSYCFDFTVWEMYGSLLHGGKLIIISADAVIDQNLYLELLKKERVTVLNQTPQSMYNLIELEQTSQRQLSVRYVFLGGEALKPSLLKPFKERYPDTAFTNLYGPTESTIFVTYKRLLEPEDFISNLSNIGSVIPMMKAYVLDSHLNLLPFGIPGELYVSGNGVSRGYINNEELTADRFIQSPYEDGMVLYKTGDLVRMMPKGDIVYLGRTDSQVKIRGYRIELGEIENALTKHPQVNDAVLMVHESVGGSKLLCAYYTSQTTPSTEELSMHLSGFLPDYMIPSVFIDVEAFPMNRSGKIDKTQLPKPNAEMERTVAVEPENHVEAKLLDIWQEILGLDRISVLDNFFFIGGDSLNALKVSALAKKHMEVEISPRDLFKYKTIRDLGKYVEGLKKTEYVTIQKVETAPFYPTSSAQKRQYVLNMIDSGISYNLPGGLHIRGEVDFDKLQKAFTEIVLRHESLRTSFELKDGEPVQIVHDTVDFHIEQEAVETLTLDECIKAFVRPFDLKRAPLLRVKLISFSQKKHVLLFDMHHIISDGASINVMVGELVGLYSGSSLPRFQVQYKDYSAWHNELLKSEKMQQQEEYWLERFSGEIPMLSLPTDYSRPSVQSYKGSRLSFSIDEKLTKQIKQLCAETETTLFMMLYSAYSVLLSKYTGQEDVVVGTPVEGRRHEDLRQIIGMFVNTLAVRSYPAGDKPFKVFLDEVKEDLINAYEHQEYPFETLVEKLEIKRDPSRNPLFDTMFVLQNTDLSVLSDIGFSAEFFEYKSNTSKFDITIEALDQGDTIEYSIEYYTDLFEEETIKRLSSHYINALAYIVEHPTKRLCDIDILSKHERHQLLVEFNDTAAEFPRDKTIHQIFEEQAENTPDNIALVFKGETMTYAQLNKRANQLARTLREQGIGPDDIVGLIVDRSFEMIISIFAVLKAGGAYMPIDPGYPSERKQYMLENSGAKALLTKQSFLSDITFDGLIIDLEDESSYAADGSNPEHVNKPNDLLYIIYTSGSTGKPKGVMIEHRNLVGLLFNDRFEFDFNASDVWTLFHSYCFDFTVWEMYGSLLRGGKLIIISADAVIDQNLYLELLKKERVTVLNQTPQSMYNLIELEQTSQRQLSVRYVFLGGEALKPSLLKPFKERYPDTAFTNLYGPTESTIFVTYKRLLEPEDFISNLSNIGSVIPMMKAYVLDSHLNLLPFGIPGELYVSGNGVSRGYINNEELTADRFIQSPYEDGTVLYKTGDLVRMMPKGDIVYLGRTDSQVKIRGYRIELGEIENALTKHPQVNDAVLMVHESVGGSKLLCAYYTSQTTPSTEELSMHLSGFLPDYMIPSVFIDVEAFPMNRSGKIDKTQLPKPNVTNMSDKQVIPRNEMERFISNAWRTVLKVPAVGIDDDFFSIGGDSLSAIKVISKLDLGIKIIDLYTYSTIRKLAEHISASTENNTLLINMSRDYNPSHRNVICFPFGGGSAISYNKISKSAADNKANLNIYSVKIPGHDFGVQEELQPLEYVAKQIAAEIIDTIQGEIVLYGHCAGNGLMQAVARFLEAEGVKIKAVFIGGLFAPKYINLYGWYDKPFGFYTDNSVRRFLNNAGLSGEMLYNEEYINHMRRVLRHVRQNYNRYMYRLCKYHADDKVNAPLFLVVGDKDTATKNYEKNYKSWRRYYNSVQLHVLKKGEHFFIHTHSDVLVDLFKKRLILGSYAMGADLMDIPFILLHISTLLTLILFVFIIRFKNKKSLHYYFLFAIGDLFLWCLLSLLQQYIIRNNEVTYMFLNKSIDSVTILLSVLLFFVGYVYAKSDVKFKNRLNFLFVIPVLFIALIWTNDLHHLSYVKYADVNSERILGPFGFATNYLNIGFMALALFFLIKASIRNSGFFSRQSGLMILGAAVPIAVDVAYFTHLYTFPKYYDAIAFSITSICFLVAIFRFELFNVLPVALQTVVDHISDSYIVLNEQLELTDYNKPFVDMFGSVFSFKRKQALDKILIEDSEYSKTIKKKLNGSISSQKPQSFEIHVEKERYNRYFIVEITPVLSAGKIICTIILFKDITEQKKDAELIAKTRYKLIESEHLASLGQLVGGIAHNLKTPIMSVVGGLEGLSDLINEYDESIEDSEITAQDHHEIAGDMHVWIGKMKEYVSYMSDIITAVKGQAVQLTASTTGSFTVKELIKRIDILMNHELKRYSCSMDVKCSIDKNTIVKGELNSFIQVIDNLIINSMQAYEGQSGVIEFLVSKQGDMLLFEIKDYASGMPEDVKDKLFKEMITTKAKNGTGLGLYMSYSTITGRFGGEMWFESVLGKGTTFHILIPAL